MEDLKLEVGQYWHKPELGVEWLLVKKYKSGRFECKCTKSGGLWKLGELFTWASFYENGYILGRHPDNIAPEPQPEQWHPKEGELVWVKFLEVKAIFRNIVNGNPYIENYDIINEPFPVTLSELEPYTNQDKPKIDFSAAGQWLKSGNTVVCTTGEVEDEYFYCYYLGDGVGLYKKLRTSISWQLRTPEQINPILDLIKQL